MTKKSKFSVKYEQEKNENCLSSFGGIPIFLEFLKGIGFDHIVSSKFTPKSNQGYHVLHHILAVILINITVGDSVAG